MPDAFGWANYVNEQDKKRKGNLRPLGTVQSDGTFIREPGQPASQPFNTDYQAQPNSGGMGGDFSDAPAPAATPAPAPVSGTANPAARREHILTIMNGNQPPEDFLYGNTGKAGPDGQPGMTIEKARMRPNGEVGDAAPWLDMQGFAEKKRLYENDPNVKLMNYINGVRNPYDQADLTRRMLSDKTAGENAKRGLDIEAQKNDLLKRQLEEKNSIKYRIEDFMLKNPGSTTMDALNHIDKVDVAATTAENRKKVGTGDKPTGPTDRPRSQAQEEVDTYETFGSDVGKLMTDTNPETGKRKASLGDIAKRMYRENQATPGYVGSRQAQLLKWLNQNYSQQELQKYLGTDDDLLTATTGGLLPRAAAGAGIAGTLGAGQLAAGGTLGVKAAGLAGAAGPAVPIIAAIPGMYRSANNAQFGEKLRGLFGAHNEDDMARSALREFLKNQNQPLRP